jgi:hypothetical protein
MHSAMTDGFDVVDVVNRAVFGMEQIFDANLKSFVMGGDGLCFFDSTAVYILFIIRAIFTNPAHNALGHNPADIGTEKLIFNRRTAAVNRQNHLVSLKMGH